METARPKPRTRLHLDHPLGVAQTVPLDRDQAHYLFGVMRLKPGDAVALFNGRDGEWLAQVTQAGKRGGELTCLHQSAPQGMPPDVWLLFAPIKKARTDFIVEKAVELGAARICPVQTDFTNSDRIRQDRLQAHAVEAAEQCGATYVPQVGELTRLDRMLNDWPQDRRLIFCDEGFAAEQGDDTPIAGEQQTPASMLLSDQIAALDTARQTPWAILIGPEGGFSPAERAHLRGLDFALAVSLGPRILRADTAAVAALTLWQAAAGDW
ncbi:MAG: 16S rRNA (uracil(1498)-N(3))-methyltransferase [Pseudooceanicola sp.]